jgi:hypothetical protein
MSARGGIRVRDYIGASVREVFRKGKGSLDSSMNSHTLSILLLLLLLLILLFFFFFLDHSHTYPFSILRLSSASCVI